MGYREESQGKESSKVLLEKESGDAPSIGGASRVECLTQHSPVCWRTRLEEPEAQLREKASEDTGEAEAGDELASEGKRRQR